MIPISVFVLLAVLAAVISGVSSTVSVGLGSEEGNRNRPWLPPYLGGNPENEEIHLYSSGVQVAPHEAQGKGLHHADVGVPTSFTIRWSDEEEKAPPHENGNVVDKYFIYVWIANADQIFIAEVVNDGNGTLTATYESSFPGDYLVYIEVVELENHDEGVPITGSPFALTIEGEPSLNLEELPVCGTEEEEDIASTFWRPGTWVSSNIASASHGVMRDGWVFQPKTCVYDTFSYDDLMLLAGQEEPTWLLILGGSIQRGVFLTLVDMVLAQGQKDNFGSSALAKCWGYADIQIGNLRLTYQDFRLYTVNRVEDSTVCDDEKVESGSTAMFVRSCKHFLDWTIFREGTDWPTVIFAPSHLVDSEQAPNAAIEVVMSALPAGWDGDLLMADHMAGFGYHWRAGNPTMTALKDVDLRYHRVKNKEDNGRSKMDGYQEQDPRTSFMSVFPMEQAKLFENQNTRGGKRRYGGSVHYHYVASNSSAEAYSGAKMVHSTMTEMISNIIIGKAVGTKEAMYAGSSSERKDVDHRTRIGDTIQVCTDCPSGLLPFHVQPKPNLVCAITSALLGHAPKGQVWDKKLCPEWCLATKPVRQKRTESGLVDVRSCPVEVPQP